MKRTTTLLAVPHENVYTGEPVTPGCIAKAVQGFELTEGTDYTVSYRSNVLCGIAEMILTPTGGKGEDLTVQFMIVPEKAEILGVTGGDGAIRAAVADQWATGIGGYEIEYRKAGEEGWRAAELAKGQTEADLPEAEAGAEYEVRARARVDGITAVIWMDAPFYGEYSETVTITMP